VRLGDARARRGFVALLVLAHVAAIATFIPWALLTLLVLPLTISVSRSVLSGTTGPALIPLLGKTGKLQLIFAATFAIGLAIH